MDAGTAKTGYIMNQAYFVYDPSDGLYHRYQYGGIHQGDEGPVAVKNVIFQYCQTGHYATTDYLDINVHTTECGYFMTDGKAIPTLPSRKLSEMRIHSNKHESKDKQEKNQETESS